ncbi:MAG: hypothetical protein WCI77_05345 [Candidatus Omnitrophota bacterium]
MKKTIFILVLVSVFSLLFVLSGCGPNPGIYGKPLTETKATAIASVLKAPDKFIGHVIRLEGKIIQECPAGGWFMLKDDTGVIFVDLHPSEIAIPQAVNHRVAVQGKVKNDSSQVFVIGEGVELK